MSSKTFKTINLILLLPSAVSRLAGRNSSLIFPNNHSSFSVEFSISCSSQSPAALISSRFYTPFVNQFTWVRKYYPNFRTTLIDSSMCPRPGTLKTTYMLFPTALIFNLKSKLLPKPNKFTTLSAMTLRNFMPMHIELPKHLCPCANFFPKFQPLIKPALVSLGNTL